MVPAVNRSMRRWCRPAGTALRHAEPSAPALPAPLPQQLAARVSGASAAPPPRCCCCHIAAHGNAPWIAPTAATAAALPHDGGEARRGDSPKPECRPLALAFAASTARAREWMTCGLRMMKPSRTSFRTFCPATHKRTHTRTRHAHTRTGGRAAGGGRAGGQSTFTPTDPPSSESRLRIGVWLPAAAAAALLHRCSAASLDRAARRRAAATAAPRLAASCAPPRPRRTPSACTAAQQPPLLPGGARLTGVGHTDVIDLIGVQPHLPEAAAQDGGGQPLLQLERDLRGDGQSGSSGCVARGGPLAGHTASGNDARATGRAGQPRLAPPAQVPARCMRPPPAGTCHAAPVRWPDSRGRFRRVEAS